MLEKKVLSHFQQQLGSQATPHQREASETLYSSNSPDDPKTLETSETPAVSEVVDRRVVS